MTQKNLIEIIQDCWKQNYWDMGIYRWINRNLARLKNIYAVAFVITITLAFLNILAPVVITAASFIVLIWLGGIDHFIIGRRIRRILAELNKQGIILNQIGLMHYCKDILPR